MRFQMFSARRTVDLKVRRVEVNQGLDLNLLLENLVITGTCLSSRKDSGIIFCGVLPVSHFVHQRKLLFWKSMFLSENDVLVSLSRLTACRFLSTGSLYNVTSRELSTSKIKHSVWNVFVNSVVLWWTLYTCVLVLLFFIGLVFVFIMIFLCCLMT